MTSPQDKRLGVALVLLSAVGYAMLPVFAQNVQQSGMNSLDLGIWRYLLAVPLFWGLVVSVRRGQREPSTLPRAKLLLNGTLLSLAGLCAFYGFERIPAGTFVILFYTYPAMLAMVGLFLGDRLPPIGWVALALTFIGVVMTSIGQEAGTLNEDFLIGGGLALTNAVIVTTLITINARLLRGQANVLTGTALNATGGLLLYLLIFAVRGLPGQGLQMPASETAWVFLVLLVIFSTTLPHFSFTSGIQKLGAAQSGIVASVEPLLTAFFAYIFLGQMLTWVQVLGGVVIVLSVILLQVSNRVWAWWMQVKPNARG
jgi:drug/metabolite transporter (DMT)-like permease